SPTSHRSASWDFLHCVSVTLRSSCPAPRATDLQARQPVSFRCQSPRVAPLALLGIPSAAPRRTVGASRDFLHCVSVTLRSQSQALLEVTAAMACQPQGAAVEVLQNPFAPHGQFEKRRPQCSAEVRPPLTPVDTRIGEPAPQSTCL